LKYQCKKGSQEHHVPESLFLWSKREDLNLRPLGPEMRLKFEGSKVKLGGCWEK